MQWRHSLFWDVMQYRMAASYRCFGTAYRSQVHESSSPRRIPEGQRPLCLLAWSCLSICLHITWESPNRFSLQPVWKFYWTLSTHEQFWLQRQFRSFAQTPACIPVCISVLIPSLIIGAKTFWQKAVGKNTHSVYLTIKQKEIFHIITWGPRWHSG